MGPYLPDCLRETSLVTLNPRPANSKCPRLGRTDWSSGSPVSCSWNIHRARNFASHKGGNGRKQTWSLPTRTPDGKTTMHFDATFSYRRPLETVVPYSLLPITHRSFEISSIVQIYRPEPGSSRKCFRLRALPHTIKLKQPQRPSHQTS